MTLFHRLDSGQSARRIAYTQVGDASALNLFICLPGLLETRASFHPLISSAAELDNCCWVSLDYCGRGESDALSSNEKYATSVYLADTEDLIAYLLSSKASEPDKKLHLVGTSMGGILAMHLLQRLDRKVDTLILNDIGMSLNWSALVGLYLQMNESPSKINERQVDPRAIEAVNTSSHFDLPYDFDLFSMQFHPLLKNHTGKLVLLHNAHSSICPTGIAEQSKRRVPELILWTQEGSSHPTQWNATSIQKLTQLLDLKPKAIESSQDHHKQPQDPAKVGQRSWWSRLKIFSRSYS